MIFPNFLVYLSLFACILPFTQSGKAVIAGGNTASNNAGVYESFIDLASPGGRDSYIGVITAGNTWSTAKSVADGIIYRLRRTYGADKVEWLPFHKSNGNICTGTSLNSKLRSMTGIFINGGDTQLIMDCFFRNGRTSSALSVIKSRYRSNDLAVFASSAGALAIQSTPIIEGRESYSALVSGPQYDNNGGFDLFTNGFIDVHFRDRGRQGRLIRLVNDLKSRSSYGFGIDEDTAMIVNGNTFTVAGRHGVTIVDVRNAVRNNRNGRWGLDNVALTYLTRGDIYNFNTRGIGYASWKRTQTRSSSATTSNNIFSDGTWTSMATTLARSSRSTSTFGYTSNTRPRYRVNMRKTANGVTGTSNGLTFTSYRDMRVDLYCYANC